MLPQLDTRLNFLSGFTLLALCLAGFLESAFLFSADEVDFEKDIWPILVKRCHDCHNESNEEGQLRLDAKTAFEAGGVSGKLFSAREQGPSLLLDRLEGKGDLPRMPLDEDPLSKKEMKNIRDWIAAGANWPDHIGAKIKVRKPHWAYQTIQRPKTGPRLEPWAVNPIDSFVAQVHRQRKLTHSTEAPRGKLLRRLYLDLVGYSPSVEDLDAFITDPSPDAYEQIVDRLLASPAFGEKWARHWLDLARYADTNGFQADQFRSVWPYRDWVIRSVNLDKPFDEFTIEQMAGDLLPASTTDQQIATGFHRLTTCNVEAGVDPEENRINQIVDRVNTTGTVWFGTTFECMQCHNHKYDPFTQREYYQLFAFFNQTPVEVKDSGNNIQYEFYGPKMELPLDPALEAERNSLSEKKKKLGLDLKKIESAFEKEFLKWLANSQAEKTETWIPLKVTHFESSAGSTMIPQPDGSIRIGGPTPDVDNYTVTCESDLNEINGFRIEALSDPTLPKQGPGRRDTGNPNFVLYEFQAQQEVDGKRSDLDLKDGLADFSQKNFDVSGLIDNNPKTGWAVAPQFGKSHWASFLTVQPVRNTGDNRKLIFKFDQHYGGGRVIGRLRISALKGKRTAGNVPDDIQKLLRIAPTKRKPVQLAKLRKHFLGLQPQVKSLTASLKQIQSRIDQIQPKTTLVMRETEKRMSFLFKRGNFLDRGQQVKAGTPSVLHRGSFSTNSSRLDFARWIFSPENPLTARVVVNRWWEEIFGRGIVSTSEDFGTQGEPPTHPELLDWLASELIDSGWSTKHVIRKIVLSRTYRQNSRLRSELLQTDPDNRWLTRGPRFRISAELIRDNALAVTGRYSTEMLGEPIFPPQPPGIWRHVGRNEPKYKTSTGGDRFRRGIYVFWRRSAPYPSFTNFDAPDRASCVVSRSKTNTPLQALTLLNDQAMVELTRSYATDINGWKLTLEKKLVQVFRECTGRFPNAAELGYLQRFFLGEQAYYSKFTDKARLVLGNTSKTPLPDQAETAAWFRVAHLMFNLDETITKD